MTPFGAGLTVEVLGTASDRHGDTTETVKGTIPGCAFAPESSSEETDGRALVDRSASLYVPAGALAVSAQDKLRFPDGTVWHVEGEPQSWTNPWSGQSPGGVVRLRRVTG